MLSQFAGRFLRHSAAGKGLCVNVFCCKAKCAARHSSARSRKNAGGWFYDADVKFVFKTFSVLFVQRFIGRFFDECFRIVFTQVPVNDKMQQVYHRC